MLTWPLDDKGRPKVPLMLTLVLLFALRPILFWIVSLSFGQDRSLLLSMFFPEPELWLAQMAAAGPALFVIVVLSFREKLSGAWQRLWRLAPGALALSWLMDLAIPLNILARSSGDFELSMALSLMLLFWVGLYL